MRTVYIDTEFKCHAIDDGIMRSVETDFFDGKCDAFVEGYRLIPEGDVWKRSDGTVFHGRMIAPWKPYEKLEEVQREFELRMLEEYSEALKVLGVTV